MYLTKSSVVGYELVLTNGCRLSFKTNRALAQAVANCLLAETDAMAVILGRCLRLHADSTGVIHKADVTDAVLSYLGRELDRVESLTPAGYSPVAAGCEGVDAPEPFAGVSSFRR